MGHPTDIFLAPLAASTFTCAICWDVLKDATSFKECGHTFCELCVDECIARKTRCPNCRRPVQTGSNPNYAMRDVVDSLEVRCQVESCGWKGTVGELHQHRDVCGFGINKKRGKKNTPLPQQSQSDDEERPQRPSSPHDTRETAIVIDSSDWSGDEGARKPSAAAAAATNAGATLGSGGGRKPSPSKAGNTPLKRNPFVGEGLSIFGSGGRKPSPSKFGSGGKSGGGSGLRGGASPFSGGRAMNYLMASRRKSPSSGVAAVARTGANPANEHSNNMDQPALAPIPQRKSKRSGATKARENMAAMLRGDYSHLSMDRQFGLYSDNVRGGRSENGVGTNPSVSATKPAAVARAKNGGGSQLRCQEPKNQNAKNHHCQNQNRGCRRLAVIRVI
jgi:hypothetical protein